jgi:integrase/recombinase XerD
MHREVKSHQESPKRRKERAVVLSANGREKPDAVVVNGKTERHPEGAYYIEWFGITPRVGTVSTSAA